jgi:arsenate reductase (thioredoxin)
LAVASLGARPVEHVVFACLDNGGGSQMAAAFFNLMADPGRAAAVSAGTRPGDRIAPEVVVAMKEVGVDLSRARPRLLTGELVHRADLLVTMGAGVECPYVLGLRTETWTLGDPVGQSLDQVRAIRDAVGLMVAQLVSARGWARRMS